MSISVTIYVTVLAVDTLTRGSNDLNCMNISSILWCEWTKTKGQRKRKNEKERELLFKISWHN